MKTNMNRYGVVGVRRVRELEAENERLRGVLEQAVEELAPHAGQPGELQELVTDFVSAGRWALRKGHSGAVKEESA